MNRTNRLSTYVGAATAAAIGATMGTEVTADTIVFDVGVTYGGGWVPGSGGTSWSSSHLDTAGLMQMDALGAQMLFIGNGFRSAWNSSSGGPFTGNYRAMGWALGSGTNFNNSKSESGEQGRLQVAFTFNGMGFGKGSKSKNVRGFGAGENVDSMNKFMPGGFAGSSYFTSSSGSVSSGEKGLAAGRHFIGFRVVEDWSAEELAFNYGWVDLSFDYEAGTLTVHRWAYETDVNTAASTPVVPGPGGLFALALGAAGIRGRRQRVA
ncbi:MAG: hypothetical protein CMJ34_04010 [Phycisphaerae bacterium]|nr:hypothetical protein [Phycisphaerae bacterium]